MADSTLWTPVRVGIDEGMELSGRRENHGSELIPSGGAVVTDPHDRPAAIKPGACSAIVNDRHGRRQCSRRGWFALRAPEAIVVAPLCSTHLQRLIKHGGAVRVDRH